MMTALKPLRYVVGLVPILALILWMGVDGGGTEYARSPQDVRAALKSAHVPTHVLGQHVAGSRVRVVEGGHVVTALLDHEGREIIHFVSTIEERGGGSHVSTDVVPAPGEHAARAQEAMKKNAFATNLLDKLADEHVAAAIEGRPFDMMFATPPAAKEMIGMTPGLGNQIADANASASELAQLQQDLAREEERRRFSKEYGDDWGASGVDSDAGWGE
ncbi:MAG: hypothetical protein WA936_11955 [Erythrobacter sp.]